MAGSSVLAHAQTLKLVFPPVHLLYRYCLRNLFAMTGSLHVLNPCSHRCLLKRASHPSDHPSYPRQYQTVSELTIGRQGCSILVLELQVPCLCLTPPEMLKTPTSLDLPRPGCRVAFDTS